MNSILNHLKSSNEEQNYSNNLSFCFFCLCSQHGITNYETKSFNQLSLRNISRYLQLFEKKSNCDLKESTAWCICNQCSKMAVEFNELYHLWEEIKLRLSWCLEKMQDVMTKAQDKTETNIKIEINEDDENLRTAILGRTKKITKVPRVLLCKAKAPERPLSPLGECDDDTDTATSDPDPAVCVTTGAVALEMNPLDNCNSGQNDVDVEFNYYGCTGIPSEPEPATDEDMQINMKMELDVSDEVNDSPSLGITESVTSLSNQEDKPSMKKLKCSACRAQFQIDKEKVGERHLRLHNIQYHCDQLFLSHKSDSISPSQFKIICGELLFNDLINEKDGEGTICVYCDKQFRCPSKFKGKWQYYSRVKCHFVDHHYNELVEKLTEIQSDPDLPLKVSQRNITGKMCECGAFVQFLQSQRAHYKFHCPLTAKEKQKTAPDVLTRRRKCNESITITNRDSSLSNNGISHRECVKKKSAPIPKVFSLSCNYCNYKCLDRLNNRKTYNMKMHLLRFHPEHFFLAEEDNDGGVLQSQWKHKSLHVRQIVITVLFPKFVIRGAMSISCSLCGTKYQNKKCTNGFKLLRKHLINKHFHELKENLKTILMDYSDSSHLTPTNIVKQTCSEKKEQIKDAETNYFQTNPIFPVDESMDESHDYIVPCNVDPLATD